jgi:hypothetical protein
MQRAICSGRNRSCRSPLRNALMVPSIHWGPGNKDQQVLVLVFHRASTSKISSLPICKPETLGA